MTNGFSIFERVYFGLRNSSKQSLVFLNEIGKKNSHDTHGFSILGRVYFGYIYKKLIKVATLFS